MPNRGKAIRQSKASKRRMVFGVKSRIAARRAGPTTETEKALVAQVVKDSPTEITPAQVTSLARALRRSPEAIRNMIATARENFVANAMRYVDIHKEATELALATMDFETAQKGSQWALEHISAEGKRVIEKQNDKGAGGTKVFVGVKIGNMTQPEVTVSTDGDVEPE